MHDVPLPTEFAELNGKVFSVRQRNPGHFRSSCPECRDFGHNPSSGPVDRFQMWTKSNATGGPLGWCSRCNYKWIPGRDGKKLDPDTMRRLEEQARNRQEAQDALRRKKLAEFSDHEIWKEHCERMTARQHKWWEEQGIPLDVQQYLSLGYIPEKKYKANGELHVSSAYTIPWFDHGFDFLTMQYRLTSPVNPSDKYRFEYGLDGGSNIYFSADPGDKIGDKVIVCEGAKKAMVTRYRLLDIHTDYVVIAAASKNTLAPIIERVKDAGVVYIILDPDGLKQARVAQKTIGKSAHVVRLPYKVDDGFLRYGLTKQQFSQILNTTL